MTRRTREVVIQPSDDPDRPNRDANKTFVITEVSAVKAEEWGLRAMLALGSSGIAVPQELADAGLIGVALIGYQAFLGAKMSEILPLWKEMLPACVKYNPSPGVFVPYNELLFEEVSTLLELRKQILELHTGFTLADLALKLKAATSAMSRSPSTSTSPELSEPQSA